MGTSAPLRACDCARPENNRPANEQRGRTPSVVIRIRFMRVSPLFGDLDVVDGDEPADPLVELQPNLGEVMQVPLGMMCDEISQREAHSLKNGLRPAARTGL